MPLTIGEARSQLLDHLDDQLGRRYAPDGDFTKVDRSLRSAQSRCIDDYTGAGGDRFDENIDVTTSAVDGKVNLASYEIGVIRGVLVNPNPGDTNGLYPISPGDKLQRGLIDRTERQLTLTIVRLFPIAPSPNEDDLLMGEVQGAARSWDAFDEWIVARAAAQISIKDDERRQSLAILIEDCKRSIFNQRRNPGALPWPMRRTFTVPLERRLYWLWYEREQTLQLVFNARGL